jgi:ferredoxin
MLRTLRISLAVLCFAGFCLLFADVSGILPPRLAFLAKIQFVPALLSGSFIIVAVLVALTLLFGRIYCSTICPLGVLQDVISRLGKKRRFRFHKGYLWLRVGTLVVFLLAFLTGLSLLVSLLEPYSAFGRIAAGLLAPVWQFGSNLLALASEHAGSFIVSPSPVWQKGFSTLAAAAATLGVISVLAIHSGRTWCNTLCPVGACLGFLHCFALFRPRIDPEKCTRCGVCAKGCKASCIDAGSMVMDASRCVACFNCLRDCPKQAIYYAPSRRVDLSTARENTAGDSAGTDCGRRAFSLAGLSVASLPAIAAAENAGGKPLNLSRRQRTPRETPITPPGSSGRRHFMKRCTGCQLCVSSCPNQVLSAVDYGANILLPAMSFERGFCRVNCVTCSTVCPTGAIRPITIEQKTTIQAGRAVIDAKSCLVTADEIQCTACSRICPTGAAALVGGNDGRPQKLAVDAERCLGCGACEYVCPVRPLAAIRVAGNIEHQRI